MIFFEGDIEDRIDSFLSRKIRVVKGKGSGVDDKCFFVLIYINFL